MFCFLLLTPACPQPTVCLQFDALDGAGWRISLPVSSREHQGLPPLCRGVRVGAPPSSHLLWPPGGCVSLCSCQLPHCQWRGVSWMNEGAKGFATEVGKMLCDSSPEQRSQFCYTASSYLSVVSCFRFLSYNFGSHLKKLLLQY